MAAFNQTPDINKFISLTGLKKQHADDCFKKFNNDFYTSLVSFVQSHSAFPSDAFDNTNTVKVNANEINSLLDLTYGKVKSAMAKHKMTEADAWNAMQKSKWVVESSGGAASFSGSAFGGNTTTDSSKTGPAFSGISTAQPLMGSTATKSSTSIPSVFGSGSNTTGSSNPSPFGQFGSKSTTSAPSQQPSTAPAPGFKSAFGGGTSTSTGEGDKAPAPFSSVFGKSGTPASGGDKASAPTSSFSGFGKSSTTTPSTATTAPKEIEKKKEEPVTATPPSSAAPGFKSVFGQDANKSSGPTPSTAFGKQPSSSPFGQPPANPGGFKSVFGNAPSGGSSGGFKSVFGDSANPTTTTGSTPAAPAAFANFGKSQAPAVAKAPSSDSASTVKGPKMPEAKPYKPTHHTGPLLDMPLFWKEEVEGRAPLLNMDRGFIAKNKDTLRERLLKWHEIAGPFHQGTPLQYCQIEDEDEYYARVIIKDVVRTFFHEDHRNKFKNFLYSVFHEFKSYGQPMSYLAGLCSIGLSEQETMAVLRKVNQEYLPKHWAAEASGFATNAWLIESYMQKRYPKIAEHFQKLNFWPDTFLQKILSGLCVHVLPFDLMFQFLDAFMAQGFPFQVKFVFALLEHFQEEILQVKKSEHINELYEIMRLDSKAAEPADMKKIIVNALKMDLGNLLDGIEGDRMEIYNKKVLPRLEAAPKEEAFEPCGLCEKNVPGFFCDECESAICQACHEGNKGTHQANHTVEKY